MDITGKSDPYVILRFKTQQAQTNYVKSDLNPVWNEVFTFDVQTGKEILEVMLFDKDDFGKDDFEGRIELSLDAYKDQQTHDEWFDLQAENPS